jgi:hypothetical protein
MASDRFESVERLLDEQGHDLAAGRVRVATGRSGVAIGFPQKPMIHVSWWALAAIVALACARYSNSASRARR